MNFFRDLPGPPPLIAWIVIFMTLVVNGPKTVRRLHIALDYVSTPRGIAGLLLLNLVATFIR